MKKGVKFCCLIVGLILAGSLFGWAVGSDEVRSYRTSTYGEYEERFSSNTTESRDTAHARWMDVIHEDNLSDMSINEAEKDVADVTYDAVSISGSEAFKPLDANDNRIEDSLELKVSDVGISNVEVIVLYNQRVESSRIDYSSIGAEINYDYSVINATAVTIPRARLYDLPEFPNVKMVYEDHEVHAYLDSSVPVIKADTARTAYNVTGSNVTLAVIDTGIDATHESLDDMDDNPATNDPKVIGFKDFVNFYPDPYDDHGHGTHCAGIAAGTGGSSVYKGVAPGARLVGVKVLNSGGYGSESTIIAGIDWTVQHKADYGIRIISMSLGRDYNNDGTTPMALACDAAVDAGIVVAVAAGNAGAGSKTVGDPACAKKVVTVGAIDDDREIAYFSSRGPTADGRIKPEICAVGVDVRSAEADTEKGYIPKSGTSMSTPHVAGVAALMLEYSPHLTPSEVREILRDTAVDRGVVGPDNDYGWGVVDSMFALLLSVPQEHDIKVDLPLISKYVTLNTSIPINATVFNKGLNNETNITVQLLINGSVNATKTITRLDSNANCSVNFTWKPSAEGSYNVSVYAVHVPNENITSNNLVSRYIKVLSNIYLIGYDITHGERPSSWYIDMIDDMKSEGFIVSDIVSGPITFSLLNNYDAIWIDERGGSWSADEKTALATYVENGGGLFVEGDELGDPTIVNVFDISYRGILGYPGESTDISMHSITRGVSSIYFEPVNSLDVYLPAIDVARDVEGNKMIGVRRYGNGKVVVISDEVLAYIYNADNRILGRNIFRWITLPLQAHDIEVLIDAPGAVGINVPTQINAVIVNTGLNNETDVIMDFMVDGTMLESKTIPFIQNGTDTTISFNWTPAAVGWYNVSVYAEPVLGEDYVVNNLASRYVEVPKAVLTEVYTDYGIDLDSDGLYNYLAIDVGVHVAEAGYYYLFGDLETPNRFHLTTARNYTYLPAGKQNISLLFNGIDIRRAGLNGPYTLSNLRLQEDYWNTLDTRLEAYNTSFYASTEFQLPKVVFTNVYNDTGVDTDDDGYYNYLSIDLGVNVSEPGYYHWYGELYDANGDRIASEGNSAYLENGTQLIELTFYGLMIYQHQVDGPYHLQRLKLYDDDSIQQDSRYDAHATASYNYTEFQPPGAEFNDIYSDLGVDDGDEDELYDYLVINVGVHVRDAGDYKVYGSLYEAGSYRYVVSDSNTTYLNEGNQTVQLRFDGLTLRQNKYNGTYDLRYLRLYNATYPEPAPTPTPTAPPPVTPAPLPNSGSAPEHEENPLEVENIPVGYGEQLDYRYRAHTTSYYNWTEFQRPPVEFTDSYNDFGDDSDGDDLYDYLVLDIGVTVREAGDYRIYGALYENETANYAADNSTTMYLSEGNQTVQLRFAGVPLRRTRYDGTFDLMYLRLYNATTPIPPPSPTPAPTATPAPPPATPTPPPATPTPPPNSGSAPKHEENPAEIENIPVGYGEQLDYRYYAYTTSHYNWTVFQRPPAEINDIYADEGVDIDDDGLYDYLTITLGVSVTTAGNYFIEGRLDDKNGHALEWNGNSSYLTPGNQTVRLNFDGITIRQNGVNGTFSLKQLRLYDEYWNQIDYRYDAYTTAHYNVTEFQRPPAEFTGNFADYGTDTDGDGLFDYLVIAAEINVTKGGGFRFWDDLYYYDEIAGLWRYGVDSRQSNYSYLDPGLHNLTITFEGIELRRLEYIGAFKVRLYLNAIVNDKWVSIDEAEDYTDAYNWTVFQRPPAEFNDIYAAYGEDIGGDGLYDMLTIDVGVEVRKGGYYRVEGALYDYLGTYIERTSNYSYLDIGDSGVQLDFNGIKIRENGVNGTYNLKHLQLYDNYGNQFDYRDDAHVTAYYNYTEFQTIPPCYTYTKEYIAYAWDDISTPDQLWTGCDDCSYTYALPWNFTFFCENYSSIQISTNGLITFPPDASSHCCSPDLEHTKAIAPFWGDLSQACGQGAHISVQDKEDRVTVVWYTGTFGGGCLSKAFFEVLLYENGTIRFNYNYLDNLPYSVGAGISNEIVYYANTWGDSLSVVYIPVEERAYSSTFDTGPGTYSSILGTHNGTITPSCNLSISKLYTYPCAGTGGHTEYARIYKASGTIAEANWNGYAGDWHNISFDSPFILAANETYNYTIKTGSYPQIHHNRTLRTENGWINCTEFTDANGRTYDNWIPAVKFFW